MYAIAKSPDADSGIARSLTGHCLDVAHASHQLMLGPVLRNRMEAACGHQLSDSHINRLAVLAGLHDTGKALSGFQQRIRSVGAVHHIHLVNGHVPEALAAIMARQDVQNAIQVEALSQWFSDPSAALICSICHHGGAVEQRDINGALAHVPKNMGQHTLNDLAELFKELCLTFPPGEGPALQFTDSFQHLYAGIVMLADWMGSSLPTDGPDNRPEALATLLGEQLSWSGWHSGVAFDAILNDWSPIGAQTAIGQIPLNEKLVIVEAPTGTGKTEAAMMWASRLVEKGLVDGMYFAVPLRSAAVELHQRVSSLAKYHPALQGRILRAVPGQIDTDPWQGRKSWALGSTKKAMAAPIAVGTIDQALLTVLRNRHAWMRHAALSRQLLVIDEVHASDAYMSAITAELVKRHIDLGGFVMAMSATFGEYGRALLEQRSSRDTVSAMGDPYPVVRAGNHEMTIPAPDRRYRVRLISNANKVAERNVRAGKIVLWIHATVDEAVASYEWAVNNEIPTMLHHSRFADIDRQMLDKQILDNIGVAGERQPLLICATQTVEQSLDIDADVLITTPCPGDVLLQRMGRAGRHRIEMTPDIYFIDPGELEDILPQAIRLANDKPAKMPDGYGWAYVYNPLAVHQAIAFLRKNPLVEVLNHSRELVEKSSHADYLKQVADGLFDPHWLELWSAVYGRLVAERQQGLAGVIKWSHDYADAVPSNRIPSRLGDMAVTLDLSESIDAVYGNGKIDALPVPARWLRSVSLELNSVLTVGDSAEGEVHLTIDAVSLRYGQQGLHLIR